MIEYAVLDTRFPKAVVNLITSEHPLPVLKAALANFYPESWFQIMPAEDAPRRLLARYLRRSR